MLSLCNSRRKKKTLLNFVEFFKEPYFKSRIVEDILHAEVHYETRSANLLHSPVYKGSHLMLRMPASLLWYSYPFELAKKCSPFF